MVVAGRRLHAVAQVQAEAALGNLRCFREMQAQAREVDRRRVEIAMRVAELTPLAQQRMRTANGASAGVRAGLCRQRVGG